MNKPSLAERRRLLVERCAEQRTSLAYELQALRPSHALGNRKLVLGALGATLGLALLRRRRLLALAGPALSAWRMARGLFFSLRKLA